MNLELTVTLVLLLKMELGPSSEVLHLATAEELPLTEGSPGPHTSTG